MKHQHGGFNPDSHRGGFLTKAIQIKANPGLTAESAKIFSRKKAQQSNLNTR